MGARNGSSATIILQPVGISNRTIGGSQVMKKGWNQNIDSNPEAEFSSLVSESNLYSFSSHVSLIIPDTFPGFAHCSVAFGQIYSSFQDDRTYAMQVF
jgi:hypothetical protein